MDMTEDAQRDYLVHFLMPKPVRISARSSSITNSFVNGIIPVVVPTSDEVRRALEILGMLDHVACAYCGDPFTEWDHLRPLVKDKKPTGHISEIHNLVPACGKCNQSKGNKPWREWMFGPAALSPQTRGKSDLKERAARLEAYEAWMPPTRVNFEELAGDAWDEHWRNHAEIIRLMRSAEDTARAIRERVKAGYQAEN